MTYKTPLEQSNALLKEKPKSSYKKQQNIDTTVKRATNKFVKNHYNQGIGMGNLEKTFLHGIAANQANDILSHQRGRKSSRNFRQSFADMENAMIQRFKDTIQNQNTSFYRKQEQVKKDQTNQPIMKDWEKGQVNDVVRGKTPNELIKNMEIANQPSATQLPMGNILGVAALNKEI